MQTAATRVAEARATLAQKQQELQDAEGDYEAAEVRAPVDGTVVGRKGEPGKPADEAGDQLFQIATDLYALEVTLEAKPEVTKRIHPGQPATVMVLDLQSMGLPGTVKEVKETEVIVEFGSTMPGDPPRHARRCAASVRVSEPDGVRYHWRIWNSYRAACWS